LLLWVTASFLPFCSASAQVVTNTIRVEAYVDGRSQIILRTNTAQWFHMDFAAPGRELFQNVPTIINGVQWFPLWPDPNGENRNCYCYSDVYAGVNPPLSQTVINVRRIQSRWATLVRQMPAQTNNYTLIIEFDDNPPGGSAWYITEVDFLTDITPPAVHDIRLTDVISVLGNQIVEGSYSVAPTSTSNGIDNVALEWFFPTLAQGASTSITFQVELTGLTPDELRLVSGSTVLTYQNQEGTEFTHSLGPQHVHVDLSAAQLTITADKEIYLPPEIATFSIALNAPQSLHRRAFTLAEDFEQAMFNGLDATNFPGSLVLPTGFTNGTASLMVDAAESARWGTLKVGGVWPAGLTNNLSLRTRSAPTTATLASAEFSQPFSSSETQITSSASRFLEVEVTLRDACFQPPSGLVGWWPADGNASDVQGDNDGALQNGAGYTAGVVSQAFSLDGIDDYVNVPAASQLALANAMTFTAWVKPNAVQGNYQTVIDNLRDASGGFSAGMLLLMRPGSTSLALYLSSGSEYEVGNFFQTGVFTHVAVTTEGGITKIYKAGLLVATFNTPVLAATASGTRFGTRLQGSQYFGGSIDEVAIFNRALSAAEVQAIYRAGSAGMCQAKPALAFLMVDYNRGSLAIDVSVTDTQGVEVAHISRIPLSDDDFGRTNLYTRTFQTSGVAPGPYQARADLVKVDSQELVVSDTDDFSITNQVATLVLDGSIATDKREYAGEDTARILSKVRNNSDNLQVSDLAVTVSVLDPAQATVATFSYNISTLPNGAIHQREFSFPIANRSPGAYTVRQVVVMAGAAVFTRETAFGVLASPELGRGITGEVVADPSAIHRGQDLAIQVNARNTGNVSLTNLTLLAQVIDALSLSVTQSFSYVTDLLVGGAASTNSFTYAAVRLLPRGYPVTWSAQFTYNGQAITVPLDVTGFSVTNRAPLADAGSDQTVECVTNGTATVALDGSGSTDPDSANPPANDDDLQTYVWSESGTPLGQGKTLTNSFSLGDHPVELNVTDHFGASHSDAVLIRVVDTTPPLVTCPANILTNTAGGQCTRVVTFSASATDNCDSTALAVTCDPPPGTAFPKGTATVTCNATDGSGNTGSSSFTVTVIDAEDPQITCPATVTVDTDPGACTASGVALGEPITFDNCAVAAVTNDAPAVFAFGTTNVTWTVTDTSGNMATCNQSVIVRDREAPVVTLLGDNPLVMECHTEFSDPGAIAPDNCADNTAPPIIMGSGNVNSNVVGSYLLTYTAVDPSGNTGTVTRAVAVIDTIAPLLVTSNQVVVHKCDGTVYYTLPAVSDQCDAAPVLQCTPPSGSQLGPGIHTINCTATDATGNSTNASFTVKALSPLRVVFIGQPLNDDNVADDIETDADVVNLFNPGQAIPVKVDLYDCDGINQTSILGSGLILRLDVTLRQSGGTTSTLVNDVPENSINGADVSGLMRLQNGHFQYNLDTSGYEGSTGNNSKFFRLLVTTEQQTDPGVIIGREDATLESR